MPSSAPAPAEAFPISRSEVAGLAVAELAAKFGTPLFVYDSSKIVERIADLQMFDHIRYAQKACSNLAILDLVRAPRRIGRRGQRRRNPPSIGRRVFACRRSASDRLHG